MNDKEAIQKIRESLINDSNITSLVSAENIVVRPNRSSNFPNIVIERIGVGKGISYNGDRSLVRFGVRIIVSTKETLQKTIEIYDLVQENLTKKISKITRLDPSPLGILDTGDVEIYSYGGDFTGYYWSDD